MADARWSGKELVALIGSCALFISMFGYGALKIWQLYMEDGVALAAIPIVMYLALAVTVTAIIHNEFWRQ